MTPEQATEYLTGKYRTYDQRAIRYRLAAYAMILMGLDNNSSVLDIGGGDAELEQCLREEFGWRGIYTNADHVHGVDIFRDVLDGHLNNKHAETPKGNRWYWRHDFVTCLEVAEHFPGTGAIRLIEELPGFARKGVVFSTPNARVQDVLDMDPTHRCGLRPGNFTRRDYTVEQHMLYEGYYSDGLVDGLIAYKEVS